MKKASEKLKDIKLKLNNAIDNTSFEEYFRPIPKIIKDRTRSGTGITEDDGSAKKLKKLADSTIKGREYLKSKGKLSSETTPKTSNLTQSGQMLDSIKLKKVSNKKYSVVFKEGRNDGERNVIIKNRVEKAGRVFFGLTKTERRILEKNLAKKINEVIKKIFG